MNLNSCTPNVFSLAQVNKGLKKDLPPHEAVITLYRLAQSHREHDNYTNIYKRMMLYLVVTWNNLCNLEINNCNIVTWNTLCY